MAWADMAKQAQELAMLILRRACDRVIKVDIDD